MAWRSTTTADHPLLQLSFAFSAVVTFSSSATEVFGLRFVSNLPFDLTAMGDPTRSLSSRQHFSHVHWNTQGSPPQQGGDPGRTKWKYIFYWHVWFRSCLHLETVLSTEDWWTVDAQQQSPETHYQQNQWACGGQPEEQEAPYSDCLQGEEVKRVDFLRVQINKKLDSQHWSPLQEEAEQTQILHCVQKACVDLLSVFARVLRWWHQRLEDSSLNKLLGKAS